MDLYFAIFAESDVYSWDGFSCGADFVVIEAVAHNDTACLCLPVDLNQWHPACGEELYNFLCNRSSACKGDFHSAAKDVLYFSKYN